MSSISATYMNHPEVRAIIDDLRSQRHHLQLSNLHDDAGNQYVDLVMEGGGTLGVALLGYVYVLEQLDIRFLRLAGTSAGSIVAMLLAAGGPIAQAKSEWLIEKVATKDFYDFVDGDQHIQKFLGAALDPDARKAKKVRFSTKVLDDLKNHYGLNPGQHFLEWMRELLAERGVRSTDDMFAVRAIAPPRLHDIRSGKECTPERWRQISVVTADLTTGTKTAFPDMAHLYWNDPGQVNPADFVRASMSVPVFFYPFAVENLPEGEAARAAWQRDANYRGPIPPKVLFADGGSMSNFPLSMLYQKNGNGDAPLLGIQIGTSRDSYQACDSFGNYAGAMLSSMMAFYDNDFLVQHPELQPFVGVIDTGNYNWLDFSISEEGKLDLFVRGARAAQAFLENVR